MKLTQVQQAEDQALAAGRQIDKELSPLVKEALAELLKLAADNSTAATRSAAIQVVEPLVNRYADLERFDLAEAVVVSVGGGEQSTLADWAAWMAHRASRSAGLVIAGAGHHAARSPHAARAAMNSTVAS